MLYTESMLITLNAEACKDTKPFKKVFDWKMIKGQRCHDYDTSDFGKSMDFAKRLVATCIKYDGIGLAAPQVGIFKNVLVMLNHPVGEEPTYRVFFNAKYKPIEQFGKTAAMEGCLSVPGKTFLINRWYHIKVTVDNHDHELVEMNARIFQHEYDHIQGVSIPQRFKTQHK